VEYEQVENDENEELTEIDFKHDRSQQLQTASYNRGSPNKSQKTMKTLETVVGDRIKNYYSAYKQNPKKLTQS